MLSVIDCLRILYVKTSDFFVVIKPETLLKKRVSYTKRPLYAAVSYIFVIKSHNYQLKYSRCPILRENY